MGDTSRHDLLVTIVRGVVGLAGLGGITYLAHDGVVSSDAVVAIYSTVLSLYGAAALRRASLPNGPPT